MTEHQILEAVTKQVVGLLAEKAALQQQVDGVVGERDALRTRVAELEEREKRLVRGLRAIDVRLHAEMDETAELWGGDSDGCGCFLITSKSLGQVCAVAVGLTASRGAS